MQKPSGSLWPPRQPISHDAICRKFEVEEIPAYPGTEDINFTKLKMVKTSNYPMLELDLSKVLITDVMKVLAKKTKFFLESFKMHYQAELPGGLFERMAWIYMPRSLTKCDGALRAYNGAIEKVPEKSRTWLDVVASLHKALEFDKV